MDWSVMEWVDEDWNAWMAMWETFDSAE